MTRASSAMEDVLAERQRQTEMEGWSPAHDDEHLGGDLAMAAALYAAPRPLYEVRIHAPREENAGHPVHLPGSLMWSDPWPWRKRAHVRHDLDIMVADGDKRNQHPRRRQLVIAGALILAEIERLDRARRAHADGADQPQTPKPVL